jgi:hypothetical protein
MRHPAKDVPRRPRRDDTAQQIRHRLRVAQRAKQALHPRPADAGKEVPQVHPQHRRLAHMGLRERPDATPVDESMHRPVRRNAIQNPAQNLPLQRLHPLLGRLDQPQAAARLGEDPIVVMKQPIGNPRPALQTLQIGKPRQFFRTKPQPRGEFRDGRDRRNAPVGSRRNRQHRSRTRDPLHHRQLAVVPPAGILKAHVVAQEVQHIAQSGPRLPCKARQVPRRQRTQPAPVAPQRLRTAGHQRIWFRNTGHEGPRQIPRHLRIGSEASEALQRVSLCAFHFR